MTRPARIRRAVNRPEDALQIAVVEFLALALPPNAIYFAIPNGGFRLKTEAARLQRMGVLPGAADLVVVWRGAAFFLEMKAGRGRASADQEAFAARCRSSGTPYAICRSIDAVAEKLAGWGLPLRTRLAA